MQVPAIVLRAARPLKAAATPLRGTGRNGHAEERAAGRAHYLKRTAALPTGELDWAVLAAGSNPAPAPTLIVGGRIGICGLDAATGESRGSAGFEGETKEPAVGSGRLFITSLDGTVRGLGGP